MSVSHQGNFTLSVQHGLIPTVRDIQTMSRLLLRPQSDRSEASDGDLRGSLAEAFEQEGRISCF